MHGGAFAQSVPSRVETPQSFAVHPSPETSRQAPNEGILRSVNNRTPLLPRLFAHRSNPTPREGFESGNGAVPRVPPSRGFQETGHPSVAHRWVQHPPIPIAPRVNVRRVTSVGRGSLVLPPRADGSVCPVSFSSRPCAPLHRLATPPHRGHATVPLDTLQ